MAFEYALETDIELFLGITASSKTATLTAYEAIAQEIVNKYCNVDTFATTTDRTQTIYELWQYAYLKNTPVTGITSIKTKDDHAGSTLTTIDSTSYHYESTTGKIHYTGSHLTNRFGIEILYDHGYANQAAFPEDLVHATVQIASRLYLSSYETDSDKHFDQNTRNIADTVLTFSNSELPREAKLILDKYRRYVA